MNSQNHGILRSWYEDRGFGVVQVPNSRTQRYFLHASQIAEGPDHIQVGYEVYFDIAPPYKDGQLQQAVNR
jgi:cold shock CspA family protein